MAGSMVAGMDSQEADPGAALPALHVRLLGPLKIGRNGTDLPLPPSRKVRALIAYLALARQPVARTQLCELLWDIPDDPRGELRWCLSRVRSLIDQPGRRRVESQGDTIRLDLSDCIVDAIEVARAAQERFDTLDKEALQSLAGLFGGDFLEGLEIDRNPAFGNWLTAQRHRYRACHAALLEHLVGSGIDDEAMFAHLGKWLELSPFDPRVHEILLNALARRGQLREGEEHLKVTERLFEAEGLDCASLRNVWKAARAAALRTEPVRSATAAVATVTSVSEPDREAGSPPARRASIAVMPFVDHSPDTDGSGGSSDGLAHDVITRLAKLRSLFVVAQGTVFALHERRIGPEDAGRMLNVDYVVGGSLKRQGKRLSVSAELIETRTARIVWAEIFNRTLDDAFLVLDEIGNRIVASIASEIETIERNRAILKPPNSLDAWESHHRGLWHMYRFTQADNERAQHFFQTAIRLDPTFARAYAGLSFTHFQDAFQGWGTRSSAIDRAFEAAGQSLMADERDPTAHWAMGRALWLRRQQGDAITELENAVDLSPNFAVGHYTLAFVHAQSGDARAAIGASDHSRALSPYDPFLFGMLGARAMALVRLGRFDEAADFGVRAASRPNAAAHILAIAAFTLALSGRLDEARSYRAAIHKALPRYRVDDFLAAMQFDAVGEKLFRKAGKLLALT